MPLLPKYITQSKILETSASRCVAALFAVSIVSMLALPKQAHAQQDAAKLSPKQQEARALAMARGLGKEACRLLYQDEISKGFRPERYTFSYKSPYQQQATDYVLYRVPCWTGAYNQGDAYVLFGGYDGIKRLSFAVPEYDTAYENGDSDGKVSSITVTGYATRDTLVLSDFNPKTRTIRAFNKSRGLGDAFTSGIWRFEGEGFRLKKYDVDAEFDGEQKPRTIVSFKDAK